MKRDVHRDRGPERETFRTRLARELARRCTDNPHYSLRAFALDLDVDHSTLSQILRGKRPASQATIERLCKRLSLSTADIEAFVAAEAAAVPDLAQSRAEELAHDVAAAISDGCHYAILELVRLDSFRPDSRWIARVLGIEIDEVNVALQRLLRLRLLEMSEPGRWTALCGDTTATVAGFTREALERLARLSRSLPIDGGDGEDGGDASRAVREHSSITLAVDTRRLPEALARIARLQNEIVELLESAGPRDDVYRLEIHFFPMTRLQAEKDRRDG